MAKSLMDMQLKETSQLTGADWAIWLERAADEWDVLACHKLNPQLRNELLQYIQLGPVKGWLNGALTGSRSRSRAVPPKSKIPGMKMYVFPDQVTQRLILVGGAGLSDAAQRFWRVVALGNSGRSFLDRSNASVPLGPDTSIPYHLPKALDRALGIVVQAGKASGGWLAIRSGDYFEIKAQWNCESCLETRLPVEANPLLREFARSRQFRLVQKGDADWAMVPRSGLSSTTRAWLALPLLIGQRLIGMIALWGESAFPPFECENLGQLAERIAPSVEGSIMFADLTNHLHRMAMLNDFAVTISSASDPEQIATRMFALLRRSFGTERIDLIVFSSDGGNVQRYYDRDGAVTLQTMSTDEITVPWAVEKGDAFRADALSPNSDEYRASYPGSRSALVVPIKYRRQVIGTLGLESSKEGAFTIYDEHLLVVIASHLAGLLENGRLRREAEARARNLSMIHEVAERVIGLTDAREVGRLASELMARNFDYELAGVALVTGPGGELRLAGIGGSAAELVREVLTSAEAVRQGGIVSRVAATGQSALVADVTSDPIYYPIPNWDAGSEMCVPLKDGDTVIGVIDVESQRKNAFSQNDLLVLESLASILSSVIVNVGQYQKLQATVDQLRSARQELQEHIAAQRMAESRLIQAAKLAAVGEMAAGIAHELNNPLTTVCGFTELVLDEIPEDARVRADLDLVLREANRARDVVRRLLDFSRQSESVRIRSDINEIVTDVLALVNHLLHTSGVTPTTKLAGNLPWISVDRNQIKQVVLNLVHNALHAMPEGGKLVVTSDIRKRDKRDWVVVAVGDSGTGIPAENLERVFEPFFTTRSKDGGTGLGLSVSYGIISDHGGFIDVESQVNRGSTFTIWLPVETEE